MFFDCNMQQKSAIAALYAMYQYFIRCSNRHDQDIINRRHFFYDYHVFLLSKPVVTTEAVNVVRYYLQEAQKNFAATIIGSKNFYTLFKTICQCSLENIVEVYHFGVFLGLPDIKQLEDKPIWQLFDELLCKSDYWLEKDMVYHGDSKVEIVQRYAGEL